MDWPDADRRDAALERVLAQIVQPVRLSRHELAAVFLVSHGLRYDDAGAMLHLSPETIREYMKHARNKLDARSQTHAVATALRLGLIS